MDCLPGLSGRLAHLQSSNILITKMKSLLAELNMRYFNSANGSEDIFEAIKLEDLRRIIGNTSRKLTWTSISRFTQYIE